MWRQGGHAAPSPKRHQPNAVCRLFACSSFPKAASRLCVLFRLKHSLPHLSPLDTRGIGTMPAGEKRLQRSRITLRQLHGSLGGAETSARRSPLAPVGPLGGRCPPPPAAGLGKTALLLWALLATAQVVRGLRYPLRWLPPPPPAYQCAPVSGFHSPSPHLVAAHPHAGQEACSDPGGSRCHGRCVHIQSADARWASAVVPETAVLRLCQCFRPAPRGVFLLKQSGGAG